MNKVAKSNNGKKYKIGMGHLGNGLTVWNRLEEKHGDYAIIAHIAPDREVTFYDENIPQELIDEINHTAKTSNITISATQDQPVFWMKEATV